MQLCADLVCVYGINLLLGIMQILCLSVESPYSNKPSLEKAKNCFDRYLKTIFTLCMFLLMDIRCFQISTKKCRSMPLNIWNFHESSKLIDVDIFYFVYVLIGISWIFCILYIAECSIGYFLFSLHATYLFIYIFPRVASFLGNNSTHTP